MEICKWQIKYIVSVYSQRLMEILHFSTPYIYHAITNFSKRKFKYI